MMKAYKARTLTGPHSFTIASRTTSVDAWRAQNATTSLQEQQLALSDETMA